MNLEELRNDIAKTKEGFTIHLRINYNLATNRERTLSGFAPVYGKSLSVLLLLSVDAVGMDDR